MPQVTVTINGRNYRMACDDGEEDRLVGLAERFNETVDQLKGNFGEIGDQRLTVMSGIMMVDQLSEAERRIAGLEGELATLRESRAATVDRFEESESALAARVEEAAGRIEELAQSLNKSVRASSS
jgi:cell division protein ZapA